MIYFSLVDFILSLKLEVINNMLKLDHRSPSCYRYK